MSKRPRGCKVAVESATVTPIDSHSALFGKLLRGQEAVRNAEVAPKEDADEIPTPVAATTDSTKVPCTTGPCAVCEEAGASVVCELYCGKHFHSTCLPELRGRSRLGLPVWPNWVCPRCRGVHRLGPVVVPEGGDPSISAQERVANSNVFGLLDVAAGLRHGAGRNLHHLHDESCRKCGGAGTPTDPLVLCDGDVCRRAWHVACVPELAAGGVPEGSWICPECPPQNTIPLTHDKRADSVTAALGTDELPGASSPLQCAVFGEGGAAGYAASASCVQVETGVGKKEQVAIATDAAVELVAASVPFDGVLPLWAGGERSWEALVQRAQADRAKREQPPEFTRIKANRWTVKRPKLWLASRGIARSRGGDGDTCLCHVTNSHCGDTCLNRSLNMECTKATCGYGVDDERRCHNRDLQRHTKGKVIARPTPGKGWGLFAASDIPSGALVIEYVGEILDDAGTEARLREYKAAGQRHFHIMEISKDLVIDAGRCGNDSRFVNHSCRPNCGALKKDVGGETRVGIFALEDIRAGAELTYDYRFVAFEEERWECQCGEPTCRRFLGVSKKEVVNALALEACGVRAELKRNDKAASAGGDAGDSVRRLHQDNPLVFHDCRQRSGSPTDVDTLKQLSVFDLDEREVEWARHQRIFIVGSEMPAPNAFDESKSRKRATRRAIRSHSIPPRLTATAESTPDWLSDCHRSWHRYCVLRTVAEEAKTASAASVLSASQPRELESVALSPAMAGSKKRGRAARHKASANSPASLAAAVVVPGTAPPIMLTRPRIGVRRGRYAMLLRLRTDLLAALRQPMYSHERTGDGQVGPSDDQGRVMEGSCGPSIALALLSSCVRTAAQRSSTEGDADGSPLSRASTVTALQSVSHFASTLAPDLCTAATLWVTGEYLRGDDVSAGLANTDGGADGNDVTCAKCFCGGSLVCCDTCPRSFHLSCAGLSPYEMPAGTWNCPICRGKRAAARRGRAGEAEAGGLSAERAEAILRLAMSSITLR